MSKIDNRIPRKLLCRPKIPRVSLSQIFLLKRNTSCHHWIDEIVLLLKLLLLLALLLLMLLLLLLLLSIQLLLELLLLLQQAVPLLGPQLLGLQMGLGQSSIILLVLASLLCLLLWGAFNLGPCPLHQLVMGLSLPSILGPRLLSLFFLSFFSFFLCCFLSFLLLLFQLLPSLFGPLLLKLQLSSPLNILVQPLGLVVRLLRLLGPLRKSGRRL